MLSYHNDPAVKAKYVARFEAHRVADRVVQGTDFEPDTGRGCFVGCTLDSYDHSRFPVELGWPEWMGRLAEMIFEGLPEVEAPAFGADLLAAVKVGVDLEAVRVPFLVSTQERNLARLEGNPEQYAELCRAAIRGVIAFLNGPQNAEAEAEAAAWAAQAAQAAWAESAAWAWEAAAQAAWEAEAAAQARSAAESAAWAWAAQESQAHRDTLLTLLRVM